MNPERKDESVDIAQRLEHRIEGLQGSAGAILGELRWIFYALLAIAVLLLYLAGTARA
jgi:hypothetical protein